MDDISKIPRLPGDGAQDECNTQLNEPSNTTQSNRSGMILNSKLAESTQQNVPGKYFYYLYIIFCTIFS